MVLNVVGGLMALMGTVWFFQGIGVLPGSFMSGQPQWAMYGSITAIAGLGILLFARRRGT
jgi:hypothetical protein